MRIMLKETRARFRHADSRKRPTNVSLAETLVKEARELGINVSKACEEGLAAAVKAEKGRRWQEENADGIRQFNEFVEKHGNPLGHLRQF
jgi:antitoxin CcdA